jgi:hypothetical protein
VSLWQRLTWGSRRGIAGTVYGTIVAMGALAAGSHTELDPWRLAGIVAGTVVVLWIAHVYSHALGESIALGHRLDWTELADVARRELSIVLAGVGPVAALVLGAVGVLRESTALWIAMGMGLTTLAVQGVRVAALERLSRFGTFVVVTVNLALGLVIVGLKAGLSH